MTRAAVRQPRGRAARRGAARRPWSEDPGQVGPPACRSSLREHAAPAGRRPGPPRRAVDPGAVAAACAGCARSEDEDCWGELCEQARRLLDGDRAGVAVADGHELVLVAARGRVPAAARGPRRRAPACPSRGRSPGWCSPRASRTSSHDTRRHPQGGFPLNDVEGIRSSVVVPLRRRATGGGAVLTVVSSRPGRAGRARPRGRRAAGRGRARGGDRLGRAVDAAAARSRADGEELYRAVLESLGEGVVVHGHLGQVLRAQRGGAPPARPDRRRAASGRAVADPRWCMLEPDGRRLAPEDYPAARALRTGAGGARPDGAAAPPRRRGAGDVGDVRCRAWTATGAAYSVVVSFADVTEAHRLAEQAQEQARRLHAAMQLAQLATWETTLGTDDWSFSELLHQVTGQPPGRRGERRLRARSGSARPTRALLAGVGAGASSTAGPGR